MGRLDLSKYQQNPLTRDDLRRLVFDIYAVPADVTARVLQFLRYTGETAIPAWLEEISHDEQPVVAYKACEMLIGWHELDRSRYLGRGLTRESVRDLVTEMYNERGANLAILLFLRAHNDDALICWLVELCSDYDRELACNAAEMLVWLNERAALPAVSELLKSDDSNVRGAGCALLSRIGTQEAAALLLVAAQNDPNDCVRYIAVDGLEVIGESSAIHVLQRIADTDTGGDYEGRPIRDKALKVISVIQRRHS